MNRVIKFRAWDKKENVMEDVNIMAWGGANALKNPSGKGIQAVVPEDGDMSKPGDFVPMQFTGLIDNASLAEIYEGDIIDISGKIIGNIYESPQVQRERYAHIIEDMGTRTWRNTESVAMGRGCKYAQ